MNRRGLTIGLVLLLAAVVTPSSSLEAWFGRAPGSLTSGPAIFKILLGFHAALLILWSKRRPLLQQRTVVGQPVPWLPLAALTVLALVLRLIHLNSCLWMDEIFAVMDNISPPLNVILTSFASQNQHMLFSVLARICVVVFGLNEWAVRLPAVFFGVASLWALFLLGRRVTGDREALLATALLTVSYHHIWFSQNARGYSGLLFFTLAGTWLWLEAERRGSLRFWLLYSLCGALGLWTHLTMAFVLASHALISLAQLGLRRGWRQEGWWIPFASMFLAGTLALQLHALALPEFLRTGLGEVSLPSEWTDPLWVVREALRSLKLGFSSVAVLIVGGVVMALGWLDIHRRNAAAAWSFVLPGVISGGLMLAMGHNLWPRFFFFCMGFALLIAMHGALKSVELVRLPPKAGLAVAGLIILASALTVPRVYRYPKQDFTGARDYVEQFHQPVAAVGLAANAYAWYAPQWQRPVNDRQFLDLYQGQQAEWLVYTLPVHLKAWDPQTWQIVNRDYRIVREFPGTLGDGTVYVCRRGVQP
ncbi:glycosyltransferase family 39 protein [Paludibaculum fermentans]|uniref:glycosyltransferase family 39 protein n=1 Tax=Paludibaculum fermentans TaxID=1473598 RepID=UPI003EBA7B58